jgi:hypothetical protein
MRQNFVWGLIVGALAVYLWQRMGARAPVAGVNGR